MIDGRHFDLELWDTLSVQLIVLLLTFSHEHDVLKSALEMISRFICLSNPQHDRGCSDSYRTSATPTSPLRQM
jgi:hypothetical protein